MINKYAKLLLILGLCATGLPVRGMSYINYIKGFFTSKEETIERLKEPGKAIAKTVVEINTQEKYSSPTIIHIKNNRELVMKGVSTFQEFFDNKKLDNTFPSFVKITQPVVTQQLSEQLKQFVARFVTKETELFKNGYYTFVHGQPREACFLQKLYTHLWCLKTKQTANNFLFAHIKPLLKTDQERTKERIIYETLQAKGSDNDNIFGFDNVLFVNHALFANFSYRPGCCSGLYALLNMKKREYDIKSPFATLDYEWVYEKYKSEIDQLAKEYKNTCSYGSLLLFAIPKEKVNKYVFLADNCGKRTSLWIDGIGSTSNIKEIMESIYHCPKKVSLTDPLAIEFKLNKNTDLLEFCIIMTRENGGLDPSTGIQVHAFLPGDSAKLAELQKKEDILFAKIKAAIEEEENAKVQAVAVARANAIVNHLVSPEKDTQGVVPAKTMARINNIVGHIQPQE